MESTMSFVPFILDSIATVESPPFGSNSTADRGNFTSSAHGSSFHGFHRFLSFFTSPSVVMSNQDCCQGVSLSAVDLVTAVISSSSDPSKTRMKRFATFLAQMNFLSAFGILPISAYAMQDLERRFFVASPNEHTIIFDSVHALFLPSWLLLLLLSVLLKWSAKWLAKVRDTSMDWETMQINMWNSGELEDGIDVIVLNFPAS
mmetsp:Transcript_3458/g.7452  ORF Transcript_3458/g.7452 Transcript_3458/m.7452 type:complete len:203 (-) Transcript_3458:63-671(-)